VLTRIRANGTKFGRPRKVKGAIHIATAKRMKADGHTARDIAKYLGVSRATLYRYLNEEAA
jgi:DNA invertase Pin-like site-specific DNA recombinase